MPENIRFDQNAFIKCKSCSRQNIIKELLFVMDTRGFEEDNIKGRSTQVFMNKRMERNGKLLLRRNNVNRWKYQERDVHGHDKELLNMFVKQLQTN